MSSNWKYANIDAETRLQMLRQGNSELFDEEVARTRSITKAKRELGLDTTEQENWMDTIGYNYNLWNAKNAGENPEKVSKTGYAKLYLGDKERENSNSALSEFEKLERARNAAKNALNQKYRAFQSELENEFDRQYGIFEEAIVNSGASLEGGKAERLTGVLKSEFENTYKELEKEKNTELKKISDKYTGFENTLRSYEKNGSKLSELQSIANALIKNAAESDGYSAEEIIKPYAITTASKSDKAGDTPLKNAEANEETGEKRIKSLEAVNTALKDGTAAPAVKKLFGFTEDAIKRILENLGFDISLNADLAKKLYSYISKASENKK